MKNSIPKAAAQILRERFGHDTLIALATTDGITPSVRTVDAYYEDGSFYILTYALSNKMRQIGRNANVAVSGDWFTAHGKGVHLGYACSEENREILAKMRTAFASWIDNGHNDFTDENTCILRVDLTDGVLFQNGTRYDLVFSD